MRFENKVIDDFVERLTLQVLADWQYNRLYYSTNLYRLVDYWAEFGQNADGLGIINSMFNVDDREMYNIQMLNYNLPVVFGDGILEYYQIIINNVELVQLIEKVLNFECQKFSNSVICS